MRRFRPWPRQNEDKDDIDRQTASLAAVAVILLLLVCGLFLVQTLRNKAAIEDCLMAGGRNCDVLIGRQ
jgi:hypothetical protein